MRVYVSVDMEGVAGVVHPQQVKRGGEDFDLARRWMTHEVNAAIDGAMSSGASSVVVNEAHGDMRTLLLDEIDDRATVIAGSLKPGSMVAGIDGDFGVAFFLGYHAGAGTRAGILDHTYYGRVVSAVRVNGVRFDEGAINAAVCGEAGVPLGLVTGDSRVCADARERFGEIETVEVKEPLSRYAARTLTPARARPLIRDAAARAVVRARDGELRPYRPDSPFQLEIDFVNSGCADAAELVPFSERAGGLTVTYEAPDATTLLRVVRVLTAMAATTMN